MRSSAVALGRLSFRLFRPLLLIVAKVCRFGNVHHEIKPGTTVDEILPQLTAENILGVQIHQFIIQVLLVTDEPTMNLTEQLTTYVERVLAVIHIIDAVCLQQKHREGAFLEIATGTFLRHPVVGIIHGKES